MDPTTYPFRRPTHYAPVFSQLAYAYARACVGDQPCVPPFHGHGRVYSISPFCFVPVFPILCAGFLRRPSNRSIALLLYRGFRLRSSFRLSVPCVSNLKY